MTAGDDICLLYGGAKLYVLRASGVGSPSLLGRVMCTGLCKVRALERASGSETGRFLSWSDVTVRDHKWGRLEVVVLFEYDVRLLHTFLLLAYFALHQPYREAGAKPWKMRASLRFRNPVQGAGGEGLSVT